MKYTVLAMLIPPRVWAKIDKSGDCWEWTGSRRDSRYGQVQVDRKNWLVHRLIWTATHGPIPEGLCVCHRCDNVACNPAHLFLGTHADNSADMVAKERSAAGDRNASRLYPNRRPRGETHPSAKLTDAQVAEIRRRYAAGGTSLRKLGAEYNVTYRRIGQLVSGNSR